MKYLKFLPLLLVLILTINCKQRLIVNQSKTSDSKENWIPLFNGKDLNNWIVKIKGYPVNENIHNTFRAENDILKVSYDGYENFNDAFGHLFYKTPFKNYKFRMQYRFIGNQIKGGANWAIRNSGIMIHCQPPESIGLNQNFPICVEVQLLGGIDKNIERPTGNVCTPGTNIVLDGNLKTDHCIDSNSKTFYGDQWVSVEVIVLNDTITHKINGEKVLTYTQPQIGGDLKDFSEEWKSKDGEPLRSGYISLQSESHPVEFKNIEILEL